VGEKQNPPFQLSFNPSLKVDFQGSAISEKIFIRHARLGPRFSPTLPKFRRSEMGIQLPLFLEAKRRFQFKLDPPLQKGVP
jgi:hypothetical protein